MRVAIRADASSQLGVGHVMRCLTLASALRQRGHEVHFLCQPLPGHLGDLLEHQGYPVGFLDLVQDTDRSDQKATREAISQLPRRLDWLLVDHYGLDHAWESAMRPYALRLMVIDDLANRHHTCDLILDQNYVPNLERRYDGLVPEDCHRLMGPRFALLRAEFNEERAALRSRDGCVRRVLVSFGGSDPTGETQKAVIALLPFCEQGVEVEVILGRANPRLQELLTSLAGVQGVSCHAQVDDMARHIARADLALTAGGSTTWERCHLGLPGLVISVAENQVEIAEHLGRQGYQVYLGPHEQVGVDVIRRAVSKVLAHPAQLRDMSRKSMELVDGQGAMRVVDAMVKRIGDV